jgi:hypothetical protein
MDLNAQKRATTQRYKGRSLIQLDSTDTYLLPLDWARSGKIDDKKIRPPVSLNTKNYLMYNAITDSCKYIFSDSIQFIDIQSNYIYFKNHQRSYWSYFFNNHLLFKVINTDYNQDGKLNSEDPVSLYISDNHGNNLTPVIPNAHHLKSYEYIREHEIILAVLIYDQNQDGSFNKDDNELIYKIDLKNLKKSKVLIEMEIKSD